MAERVLSLHLKQAQRSQLFAHLMTYLFSIALHTTFVDNVSPGNREIAQEIAYRLFRLCGDESEEGIFLLSLEEGQVIKDALLRLQPMYEQWAKTAADTFALEHLFTCRLLLQEAEQNDEYQETSSDQRERSDESKEP